MVEGRSQKSLPTFGGEAREPRKSLLHQPSGGRKPGAAARLAPAVVGMPSYRIFWAHLEDQANEAAERCLGVKCTSTKGGADH